MISLVVCISMGESDSDDISSNHPFTIETRFKNP